MADPLTELKHSVHTHVVVMQGPTAQLAVFLLKVLDFIDDPDRERQQAEAVKLSYYIIEALAIYVQQVIDQRAAQAGPRGHAFPESVKIKGDQLLIVVGRSRSLPDKIVAKIAVLREIADCLRALAAHTGAKYPEIMDSEGHML